MNRLIGIAGPAGVGKTTIAKQFQTRKGYAIMSYAEPLKQALVVLTGYPMEYFTEINLKEEELPFGKSPRQLMQLMGTEFVREMVDEEFWIWRMEQRILAAPDALIVVDDVRFPNEAELIRHYGGVMVHLNREYATVTNHTKHRSEQKVPSDGDIIIQCGTTDERGTFKMIKRCMV